tara:strand:+ start:2771 stop:3694 length:924 start_codon:yes stop_codon:yes gene_type:complete
MERHIDVLRAANEVALKAVPIIEKTKAEISEEVLSSQLFNPYQGQTERIESFLETFHFKIVRLERLISTIIQDALNEIRTREVKFLNNEFKGFTKISPSPNSGAFINGIHYSDWINSIFVPLRRDVIGIYRVGITNGQEPVHIIKKFAGTHQMGFKDSVFNTPINQIVSLIKTLVVQTANDERLRFYKSNADTFGSISWINPFSGGTDSRSGHSTGDHYDLPSLSSSGGSPPWSNALVHFNSRATQIPLLGNDRANKSKLEKWFGTRDKSYQENVLGFQKFRLWASGKLTRTQAFDFKNNGIPLTAL